MLMLEFFSWWYGRGWNLRLTNIQNRLLNVSHLFSLPILLRTLFAPWRRIVTYPGASLEAKLRALGDNLFSRCVGFVVRIAVLCLAAVLLGLTATESLIELILWPIVPLAIPVLIILGVVL